MIRRALLSAVLLFAGIVHADWAADRDASAGYVTVTTLATAVDEAVPFAVVYLSDLPADFHTAMSGASDTDGKTIRVSTSDGTTQLACVPIGVNTGTDTGCLIFLGTGMSASSDVDYRIYVGNSSLTMPTASGGMGEQAVFAAYAGVYFPGVDVRDWTSGGRALTAVNSPGTAASGYEGITAATYSSASNNYHKYEGTPAVTDWPITSEALGYVVDVTNDHLVVGLTNSGSTAANAAMLYLSGTSGDALRFYNIGATGSAAVAGKTAFTANTWNYIVGTRDDDSGTSKSYLNGGTAATSATTITAPSWNRTTIGRTLGWSNTYQMSGRVAAVQLSSSVRSVDYVNTMQDNWAGTMYSAGSWTPNAGATGHPWFYMRRN